jgi:hypothetical protein
MIRLHAPFKVVGFSQLLSNTGALLLESHACKKCPSNICLLRPVPHPFRFVTCLTHPDGTLTPPTSEEAGDQHTTATNQSVHHRAVLRYHSTTPHHTKIA